MKINLYKWTFEFNKWFFVFISIFIGIGITIKLTGASWVETFLIPISLLYLALFKRFEKQQEEKWKLQQKQQEDERLKGIIKEVINSK